MSDIERRSAPKPDPRVRPHLPLRPLWLCRVCAAPWPCTTARLALRQEYAGNQVGLAVYLCTVLHEAVADLYRLNPHDGPELRALFDRFLGWASPRSDRR